MANLNDIATLADALERQHIVIDADRCVKVRNRNASCSRCQDVCKPGAITIQNNEISCAPSLCVNCGACITVCPVEALSSAQLPDAELTTEAFAKSFEEDDAAQPRPAVFACARIGSRRLASAESYTEVPCLGRMEPSLLMAMAAAGTPGATLVDGDCATCKYGFCSPVIDEVVATVNQVCPGGTWATRASEFPAEVLAEGDSASYGSSRREFFTEAAASMKETAMTAARATLQEKLGTVSAPKLLGERLRVTEGGTLPQFTMPRHERALNAIDALATSAGEAGAGAAGETTATSGSPSAGEAGESSLTSPLFAAVTVDSQLCNGCGLCAMFCPTGAIKATNINTATKSPQTLEFSACDCVACDLCADVCWKKAITISPTVPVAQLLDFEPVAFNVDSQQRPSDSVMDNLGRR